MTIAGPPAHQTAATRSDNDEYHTPERTSAAQPCSPPMNPPFHEHHDSPDRVVEIYPPGMSPKWLWKKYSTPQRASPQSDSATMFGSQVSSSPAIGHSAKKERNRRVAEGLLKEPQMDNGGMDTDPDMLAEQIHAESRTAELNQDALRRLDEENANIDQVSTTSSSTMVLAPTPMRLKDFMKKKRAYDNVSRAQSQTEGVFDMGDQDEGGRPSKRRVVATGGSSSSCPGTIQTTLTCNMSITLADANHCQSVLKPTVRRGGGRQGQ